VFVDEILETNKNSVIVIQSDEGPFLPNKYFKDDAYLTNIGDDPYIIHGKILNTLYLPNKHYEGQVDYLQLGFIQSSTPVNTFMRIFNYYFDTNLEILEDKSYVYEGKENPYVFEDVTEKFK
jgi:hypothetical protein